MNITEILIATGMIAAVGLLIGLFLGVASMKFEVEKNEMEEKILGILPGYNCGACGYAGCASCATAIASKEAKVNACTVGGKQVGEQIARLLGVDAENSILMTAYVKCNGNTKVTTVDYEYHGVEDCRMMAYVPSGGAKSCKYGCLGYGNCVRVCPFNAINIKNGVAVVDKAKCKACEKCVAACPKDLIEMIPYQSQYIVTCASKEKGAVVNKVCSVGCIGCGICVKNCPQNAITMENNLAYIHQNQCNACGICAEKCPKNTIL